MKHLWTKHELTNWTNCWVFAERWEAHVRLDTRCRNRPFTVIVYNKAVASFGSLREAQTEVLRRLIEVFGPILTLP